MNRRAKISALFLALCLSIAGTRTMAQHQIIGYVYESGNRGYIKYANVTLMDKDTQEKVVKVLTDQNGKYEITTAQPGDYLIQIVQDPHFERVEALSLAQGEDETTYLKHELTRKPGYIFDITLAEADAGPDTQKFALKGARVEVYNNTKRVEHQVIESLETPDFKVDLLKGNHYTILVRKDGFLSKRMEALVDVQNCILCFEGVGEVRPGVADNLTEGNQTGTLLANVELDRAEKDKVLQLSGIYYKTGSAKLDKRAKLSLDQLAIFLRDNPNLVVEIGSHTDSKGKASNNLRLSDKRAKTVYDYLIQTLGVRAERLSARGYGETQLSNKCKDGVTCSDDDHAKNRRTEIKIIETDYPANIRSLREIRNEEMMSEILEEISDTRIQVPSDEEISEVVELQEEPKEEVVVDMPKKEPEETKTVDEKQYTGYRIVIHFSRFPLPKEHDIYRAHDDIVDYKTADVNHLYMIGDYETLEDAKSDLRNKYKKQYPHAYIVGFENGIRVY